MKKVILVIICLSFMVCSNVYGVKQELKGVKIVLDAGHGGFDNGTMDYGYKEDDINLEIILKLKEVLKKEGAKVYLTRDGDYDMTKRNHHYSKQDDMYLRVKKIDRFKADYLISIHQNASGNKSAWGSQVFYYYRSTKGNELAKDINQSLKEVTHSSKPKALRSVDLLNPEYSHSCSRDICSEKCRFIKSHAISISWRHSGIQLSKG